MPLLYAYPYLVLSLATFSMFLGGWWMLVPMAWVLAGHLLIDVIIGRRTTDKGRITPPESPVYDAALILIFPLVTALMVYALWLAAYGNLSTVEIVLLTYLTGLMAGAFGITTAHELVHRPEWWMRGLGLGLLTLVIYPHFRIEHVYNHHRFAGTPSDPATARFGEALFRFIPRSVWGQYVNSWRTEVARLKRRSSAPFGMKNRMVWYSGLQIGACVAAGLVFGWIGVVVFIGQAAVAIATLETVNYIEHYGLERREIEPGRYEAFGLQHAWNTAHAMTDYPLFNLGRHSAHHVEAHLPYQKLGNPAEAPQLTTGYTGCYLLAYVPPLWRKIMDPKVEQVRAGHSAPEMVSSAPEAASTS
jgi:alkane 1-monooxygenase